MTETIAAEPDLGSLADPVIDAAVVSARELLADLHADAGWTALTDLQVLERARALEDLHRLVGAMRITAAGAVDRRHLANRYGAASTAGLLREVLRVRPGQARELVRAATAVLPDRQLTGHLSPPRLPELADAMLDGSVNGDHISVIETTLRSLPARVPAEVRATVERALVEQAELTDPTHLADIARTLAVLADPDGDLPPEQDPRKHPTLSLGRRDPFTGLTRITGHLDDEGVETLRQATDPLAAPAASNPPGDARGAASPDPAAGNAPKDPRSAATRRAHALTQALQRALRAAAVGEHGGVRPHVTVTISLEELRSQLGTALLDHGGPIPARDARRLACDAGILPAVLGTTSQVLDLGRAHRLVPPALRRALTVRDRGCAFPGCDRPPGWCDAHHIQHWADGGATSLDNTVLLCRHHHTVIHTGHWTVTMNPDGHPDHTPPVWIDPHQHPRRNHLHHHEPWSAQQVSTAGARR
ncbi:HNH endonuclease signature motif containing protein [Nakamurella leprariae]|uniref:DUF222 domain-containing protein n=1 Tax=Nakamurella leprariae TaxID=2803911 RepID=A0A938Y8R3_9ACTN|nr:HNH endonuclease signature motif containing protein [Nakamurella leprariae]MBM9468106.1 DUF222 domain-containing protein [Nakamurella leprariae]